MKHRFYEDGEEKEIDLTDEGSDVCSSSGRVIGTRGYTQFNGGRPVPVTHYPDGSSNVHCGGPCGDLYVDKFGDT
jgi:hypothetical protein